MNVSYSCICGSTMQASVSPDLADAVMAEFRAAHDGPGHEPTDRRTARKIRKQKHERWLRSLPKTGGKDA